MDSSKDIPVSGVANYEEYYKTHGVPMTSNTVKDGKVVKGYDFNEGIDYQKLFASYTTTGFQASYLGEAILEINRMIKWRLSDEPIKGNEEDDLKIMENRQKVRCTIFLGYTSNMISCGMREIIRYLCQHKMVDAIVTTTGGVEEDIMKCYAPHFMGDFYLKGRDLRLQGINRTGNLLVPNDNYCKLEEFFVPLVRDMHAEQKRSGEIFTPSKIISRMGEKIQNEESVYYWCWKNNIPVFCPAFTDGALGDILFFESYNESGFIVDLVQDIRKLNDIALQAKKSGQIILGGGVIKHHVCNANLMRNGADYSVFINTGVEYDGSDAGARPDEALSWGKIKIDAHPVKVWADASLIFPIVVAETFVRNFELATRV